MWIKITFLAILASAILTASVVPALADFEVQVRGGYFDPSDNLFKGFYDQGYIYGLYAGWTNSRGIGVLVGSDLYMKSFSYNGRKHNAKLYPITAGLQYIPLREAVVTPVFGFGWGYYRLDDKSIFTNKTINSNAFGYHALAGVRFRIFKGLFADLDLKYSFARLESVNDMNLGCWTSTVGIGYYF